MNVALSAENSRTGLCARAIVVYAGGEVHFDVLHRCLMRLMGNAVGALVGQEISHHVADGLGLLADPDFNTKQEHALLRGKKAISVFGRIDPLQTVHEAQANKIDRDILDALASVHPAGGALDETLSCIWPALATMQVDDIDGWLHRLVERWSAVNQANDGKIPANEPTIPISFFARWLGAETNAIGPAASPAGLRLIAYEALAAHLANLGVDDDATRNVAQALRTRGEPVLEAWMALLAGQVNRARALASKADKSGTCPSAELAFDVWCELLDGSCEAALQLLRNRPTAPPAKVRYFDYLLEFLQVLVHQRLNLVGDSSSDFLARADLDPNKPERLPVEVALLAFVQGVSNTEKTEDSTPGSALERLFALVRRRWNHPRSLRRSPELAHLQLELPVRAWGLPEVENVLEGKPSPGLGLGTWLAPPPWQTILEAHESQRSRGRARESVVSEADWLLVMDRRGEIVERVLVRPLHGKGRFHEPTVTGGWSAGMRGLDRERLHLARKIAKRSGRDTGQDAAVAAATLALVSTFDANSYVYVARGGSHERPVCVKSLAPQLRRTTEIHSEVLTWDPILPACGYSLVLRQEHLEVYTWNAQQVQLAQKIGHGLRVPRIQSEEFEPIISAWMDTNTSALANRAVEDAEIRGDTTLHLIFEENRDGFTLRLRVRPFAEGPFLVPAQGEEWVTQSDARATRRVRRDLSAEYAAMLALSHHFPELRELTHWDGELHLHSPSAQLAMSFEVYRAASLLHVHWPKSGFRRVIGEVSDTQVSIEARLDVDAASGLAWFLLQGRIVHDGYPALELSDILDHLSNHSGPFLALREDEYAALDDDLHRRLRQILALCDNHGGVVRISRFLAAVLEPLVTLRDLAIDTVAQVHALARRLPKVPPGLLAQLRPYQVEGFRWLARMATWDAGAVLADDMGLGKTLMTLALLLRLAKKRGPEGHSLPSLVVVPTSLLANWRIEAERFSPELRMHLWTNIRARANANKRVNSLRGRDVVLVSYGALVRDAHRLHAVNWGVLVFDEAHALKNRRAKRTLAASGLRASIRFALTGTPLENRLSELWSIFSIVNPQLLGSRERFEQRFVAPIERQADRQSLLRLQTLLRPFMLRRTREEVLSELPEKIEIVRYVKPEKEERQLYESMRKQAFDRIMQSSQQHPGQANMTALTELMRLRRACCDPKLVAPKWRGGRAKLEALRDLVDEVRAAGNKALIFSQFVDVLTQVRIWLDKEKIAYEYLDGRTPAPARQAAVDAFQSGSAELFLISLRAGGNGLNLTAANIVIILDPWWNPAVEDQASGRAHRMGQERKVTVVRLVNQGSVEEGITKLHQHKRELAASVLEAAGDSCKTLDLQTMVSLLQPD
jgi:superfamily II DNA or RNA helicase